MPRLPKLNSIDCIRRLFSVWVSYPCLKLERVREISYGLFVFAHRSARPAKSPCYVPTQSIVKKSIATWLIRTLIFISGGVFFLVVEGVLCSLAARFVSAGESDHQNLQDIEERWKASINACLPASPSVCWMNEFETEYHPDKYHVSLTSTVHVKLDGHFLILSHTRPTARKIALWKETPIKKAVVVSQRYFDLLGCDVTLLPTDLAPQKIWNKKFPIRLTVKSVSPEDYLGKVDKPGEETDLDTEARAKLSLEGENAEPNDLFPNCSRGQYEDHVKVEAKARRSSEEKAGDDLEVIDRFLVEVDDDDRQDDTRFLGVDMTISEKEEDEDDDDETQGEIPESHQEEEGKVRLYLFGRTARQKEYWYRRFVLASKETDVATDSVMMDYFTMMKPFMTHHEIDAEDLKRPKRSKPSSDIDPICYPSLNALINRIFFDFQRNAKMAEKFNKLVQKRLDSIKLPTIIEAVELTDMKLGDKAPQIKKVHCPQIDDHGLWVNFDVTFSGNIVTTVRTSINFNTLSEQEAASAVAMDETAESLQPESVGAATSFEVTSSVKPKRFIGTSTYQRLLRFIERVTFSRKFQQVVSVNPLIGRAVNSLANTNMFVSVRVISMDGTLTVNIPPPGSDRLWFAFRGVPKIKFKVEPYLNEKRLGNRLVCGMIEGVIRRIMHRNVIFPNMVDITVTGLVTSDYDRLSRTEKEDFSDAGPTEEEESAPTSDTIFDN